ncbi:hypothetical protein [Streptomyces sp. AS02]|uniref:hypothetical protein n=1 Tax=Streptomyces sp. AS02 TaxID=2938946 RepID=UPI002021A5EC|nr:hypothetical protein [Streptomyces sp. AS02]MCL8013802.1 hypothetical protein [Streptomyces sp. AS02]
MTRTIRCLIAGIALGLACSACTTTDKATENPSSSPTDAELLKLPTVDVTGDPFSELDVTPHEPSRRVIGEVHAGSERVILYTEGKKCGVVAFPSGADRKPSLQLLTAWPKNDNEGSSRLPFGPYMRTSGSGSGSTPAWAELSCSQKALVVNYSSPDASKNTKLTGSLSVSHSNDDKSISIVVSAEEANRKKILSAVASS